MLLNSYRIRKLFSKSNHAPPNGKPSPSRLPPELWIKIVSYIKDPSILASLNLTCHTLHDITEPALYNSLDICVGSVVYETTERPVLRINMRKLRSLARAMQVPRIAATVTEFGVGFHPCEIGYGDMVLPKALRRCTCGQKDDIIGQIVLPLCNLQRFRFECTRCPTVTEPHVYLEHLSTRKLRNMSYGCFCNTDKSPVPYRMFSAPCMQTLSILEWSRTPACPSPDQRRIVESKGFLPNLTRIKCGDVGTVASLASRGTLTHIYASDWPWLTRGFVAHGFPSLVHLRLERLDITISNMALNPTPYRNIQHLGKFDLISGDKSLTLRKMGPFMEQLTSLPKLTSIGLEQRYSREGIPDMSTGDQISNEMVLVSDIGDQLRMLRKVYILAYCTHPRMQEYRTWEKVQTWEVFTNSEYRPWSLWKED